MLLVADGLYLTYASGSQITGTCEDRSEQNNHVTVQPTVSGTRPSFDDVFYKPHDDADDLVEKGSIHFNMNPTLSDRRKFFVIDDISDSHQLGSMANKMLYLVLRADEGTDEMDTAAGHPAGASYNHRMPGNIGALNAIGTFSTFEELLVVG